LERQSSYRDGMPDEEHASNSTGPGPEYDDAGVPTFESVRDRIEARYATAQGAAELDAETPEGRSVDEQYGERQRAAAERLAEIRESMRPEAD
jgi:phage shock protein A